MTRPAHLIIVDYDSQWPQRFEAERLRLQNALGDYALSIEHMGSTSVPGLAAKPVIDITVGVASLALADRYCLEPIQALGYEYVPQFEDVMPRRRYFRRSDATGMRTHQIHLWEITDSEYERHIVFRDYLRAHPHEAQAYAEVKRRLAKLYDSVNDYADAKSEFIKPCEQRAFAWKNNAQNN